MFYARSGGSAAVPPYAADPQNKHQWEQEQLRHRERLAALVKSKRAIDQTEPESFKDDSLHQGRVRSRAHAEVVRNMHVGQENRKLVASLHEIAQNKCTTLKNIESEPWLPKIKNKVADNNKAADRRRKQQNLQKENEAFMKRLLSIQSSFDRRGEERDFQRHKKAVQNCRKVPPPACAREPQKKPFHLPQLQDVAGGYVAGDGSRLNTLADSQPIRPLADRTRSMPSLLGHASDVHQQQAASSSPPRKGHRRLPPSSSPGASAEGKISPSNGSTAPAPASGDVGEPAAASVTPNATSELNYSQVLRTSNELNSSQVLRSTSNSKSGRSSKGLRKMSLTQASSWGYESVVTVRSDNDNFSDSDHD